MYQIDVMSRVPVYEQIVEQTEKFILAGILKEGDKIPSVRNLSVTLSVNPNTIQKAISELDRRGLVTSVPGKGCFVSDKARKALTVVKRNNLEIIREKTEELVMAGIDKREVIAVVEEVYEKKEGLKGETAPFKDEGGQ
ncbi:MAG: GntR family transcriptional regulator [Lachnospiraceae bacterium]|nr:GntR family transcriptional regulator [Lachnospiraceae bacterium]